jgi:archaellum biogenesis ATPase FlaH
MDHYDPDCLILNGQRRRYYKSRGLPAPGDFPPTKPESKELFQTRLALVRQEKAFASPYDTKLTPRNRRPFTDLVEELYRAVVEADEDLEMRLRAECWELYRLREDRVDARLFKLLQEKALGRRLTGSSSRPKSRRSVPLSSIQGLDWKLPGFLPANDISLLWGMRGAGKTRIALEMALQLMAGKGLLDREGNYEPCNVLFVASDSGGAPIKEELQKMGIAEEEKRFERWELWCFSQEIQTAAWGIDLRGRIELFEWAKGNPGSVVILDSAKSICSKGGVDYTNNELVTEFMTFLKEVITPYVTVLVVAHDGTKPQRAGGAAAWEEIPSVVMGLMHEKDPDGRELQHSRLFRMQKCRKADEREFTYLIGADGRLKVGLGTSVIGDVCQLIVDFMLERLDQGHGCLTVEEIHEGVRARKETCKATVRNNLSRLVGGKTPKLKRVNGERSGKYQLNPYWLRSNR